MTFTEEDWNAEFGATNSFSHAVRTFLGTGPFYDPESLLGGAEMKMGLSYRDLRDWPDRETWINACVGKLTEREILRVAPRIQSKSLEI